MTSIQRTPLFDRHRSAGGRLVEFAGWQLPVQYSSVVDEHRAVRTAAGLFDVSHMGEIVVTGPGAVALVQRLTPNDVEALSVGRAHYSGLLTERGTYIDDLLVYRMGDQELMLVVNAANRAPALQWILDHANGEDAEVVDRSEETALLALQGPRAEAILARLTDSDLSALRYYRFTRGEVGGEPAIISRTGYTGEDGFELYLPPASAPRVWDELFATGEGDGLQPAGLGARDTLRLEAAMALYGHEIDDATTPWEASLGWVVKLDKGDFIGRQALVGQQRRGAPRRLVGFEVTGRGIARQGYPLSIDGEPVGEVTSGTWSPTLEKPIGMGYLPTGRPAAGEVVSVGIRGRAVPVELVELPFYRRPRPGS